MYGGTLKDRCMFQIILDCFMEGIGHSCERLFQLALSPCQDLVALHTIVNKSFLLPSVKCHSGLEKSILISRKVLSTSALFSSRSKIVAILLTICLLFFFLYMPMMRCSLNLGVSCKSIRKGSVYSLHLQLTAVIESCCEI